jgi:drug/metabolite transporter (DMT)-like permease
LILRVATRAPAQNRAEQIGSRAAAWAEATALGFVAPVFVTALSIVFLGEKVGLRRWIAAFVGPAQELEPGPAGAQRRSPAGAAQPRRHQHHREVADVAQSRPVRSASSAEAPILGIGLVVLSTVFLSTSDTTGLVRSGAAPRALRSPAATSITAR